MNAVTDHNKTPLLIACEKNRYKFVKLLVDNDADVNIADNSGTSPLHAAVDESNQQIANYILEHGKNANINIRDNWGRTPVCAAADNGDVELAECLINHGANLDIKDNEGNSAWDKAKEMNIYDIILKIKNNYDEQNENC